MEDLKTVIQKIDKLSTINKFKIGAILFVGLAATIAIVLIFQAAKKTPPTFDYSQFDRITEQNKALDQKITNLQGETMKINMRIDARNASDAHVINSIRNIDNKLSKINSNEKNTSVYNYGADSLRREYSNIRQYINSN
jgi:hypothetical protein